MIHHVIWNSFLKEYPHQTSQYSQNTESICNLLDICSPRTTDCQSIKQMKEYADGKNEHAIHHKFKLKQMFIRYLISRYERDRDRVNARNIYNRVKLKIHHDKESQKVKFEYNPQTENITSVVKEMVESLETLESVIKEAREHEILRSIQTKLDSLDSRRDTMQTDGSSSTTGSSSDDDDIIGDGYIHGRGHPPRQMYNNNTGRNGYNTVPNQSFDGAEDIINIAKSQNVIKIMDDTLNNRSYDQYQSKFLFLLLCYDTPLGAFQSRNHLVLLRMQRCDKPD